MASSVSMKSLLLAIVVVLALVISRADAVRPLLYLSPPAKPPIPGTLGIWSACTSGPVAAPRP
jgi:hypothetical protein